MIYGGLSGGFKILMNASAPFADRAVCAINSLSMGISKIGSSSMKYCNKSMAGQT